MAVYYRKKRVPMVRVKKHALAEGTLLTRSMSFLKTFLKGKIEEAGDAAERELNEQYNELRRKVK